MTATSPPRNLFVGRSAELAWLRRSDRALLTLWGPGGVGKTRLALELVELIATTREVAPSTIYCELAAAREVEAFCSRISSTAGLSGAGQLTPDGIGAALASRGPTLLLLDNLEQIVDDVALLVERWARQPGLQIVVTSRERLDVPSEHALEVEPLGCVNGDQLSDAVRLFVDRAARGDPLRAAILSQDSATIEALVTLLDGIPLAIELAAARSELFGVAGLLERLRGGFAVLERRPRRAVPERQATLRGAIDWSWQLLNDDEKRGLAQCLAFRGPFLLEDAMVVLATADDAAFLIQALRDKSMLRAVESSIQPDWPLLALYRSIGDFVAECSVLTEQQSLELARRHALHFLQNAARWAKQPPRLQQVLDDVLAAIGWMLDQADEIDAELLLAATEAVDAVLARQGPARAHGELLARVLDGTATAGASTARGRLLRSRARACQVAGELALASRVLEQARALAKALGDASLQADILADLGLLAHQKRDLAQARALYEQAIERYRIDHRPVAEACLLGNLGAIEHDQRHFQKARELYDRALALLRDERQPRLSANFQLNLAVLDQEQQRFAQAERGYEQSIALLEQGDDLQLLAIALGNFGMCKLLCGDIARAIAMQREAESLARRVGDVKTLALCQARRSAALVLAGDRNAAEGALHQAQQNAAAVRDALTGRVVELAAAFIELPPADGKADLVSPTARAEKLLSLRRRLDDASSTGDPTRPPLTDVSDEARCLSSLLSRELAARGIGPRAALPDDALIVGPDAAAFRLPDQQVFVDLGPHQAMRRIFFALLQAHGQGVPLSQDELQLAGWPDEKIAPEAAANRVYVELSKLRKRGLKPYLLRDGAGYRLDPTLAVLFVDEQLLAELRASAKSTGR